MDALSEPRRVRRYALTPLTLEHVTDRYVSWLNDPRVNQYLEVRHERQTPESVSSFVRSFAGSAEKYAWAIVDTHADRAMVGTCTLYSINRHHGSAYFGLMIGDRAHWGAGCSTDAVELLLAFAFDELGLRRVTGSCYSCNRGMVFGFKKLGFTREGVVRQAYRSAEGRYVDGYIWGMLADEWRARVRGER